jgi:hypothetical protein
MRNKTRKPILAVGKELSAVLAGLKEECVQPTILALCE